MVAQIAAAALATTMAAQLCTVPLNVYLPFASTLYCLTQGVEAGRSAAELGPVAMSECVRTQCRHATVDNSQGMYV